MLEINYLGFFIRPDSPYYSWCRGNIEMLEEIRNYFAALKFWNFEGFEFKKIRSTEIVLDQIVKILMIWKDDEIEFSRKILGKYEGLDF